MKKVFALVLALAMILAVGAAFATEPEADGNKISITNAEIGETYAAYKILDLSYQGEDAKGNPTAYTYTVNPAWAGFFKADNPVVSAVFAIDDQGYVTSGVPGENSWNATSNLSKFAEAAAKYAKENNLTAEDSVTATSASVELSTGAGYYLITSTLGSRAMIDTTPGDVEMTEKNDVDTVEKEVKEDSTGNYGATNDAQIGDTIEFKTIAAITPRSVNVKIHDTMTDGLTFNNDIKIYTDAAMTTELDSAMYTVLATPDTGDTFTIAVNDSFAATSSATQDLYITYTATLNKDAIASDISIAEVKNATTITFGDSGKSTEDSTTTETHKFSIHKHAKSAPDENLAGAEFSLKKDGTALQLIKLDDTNYRIAEEGEAGAVNTFTTVDSGDIVIWGVDADSDYALTEENPPDGYNKLSSDVTVSVSADNSTRADIENNSGTELPSTGGIGTTIFYVVGGLLVIGAAVILVARRKVSE